MKSTILTLAMLLAFSMATPQWSPPKTCIPRFINAPCSEIIAPQLFYALPQHLHKGLRRIQRLSCSMKQQQTEYSKQFDLLSIHFFAVRANVFNPQHQKERKLLTQIFDKSWEYCLTNGRPQIKPGDIINVEYVEPATLRETDLATSYRTCIDNYPGTNLMNQLTHDLVQEIREIKTVESLEEYQSKILSAGRADFADRHAHRVKCLMDIEEEIKFNEHGTSGLTRMLTGGGSERKSLQKMYRALEAALQRTESELADWKSRQTEIVRYLFNELLNQESKTQVLEGAEDRLNALLLMAGMERVDGHLADQQFLVSTIGNLHANADALLQEYRDCLNDGKGSQIGYSGELLREVRDEIVLLSGKGPADLEAQRQKHEYFWRRYVIRTQLDFANAIAASSQCFAYTERKLIYKDTM